MLVVADTSPLNYLVLMQQDTLLPMLYERVMIPPAVREELQRPRTPQTVRQWVAHPPAWLTVQPPQQSLSRQQFPRLRNGELEAIPLAQERHADLLLMDERDGRRVARDRGLRVTGIIGVLETAAIRGLIDLLSFFAQVPATTFFSSLSLHDAARDGRPAPAPLPAHP